MNLLQQFEAEQMARLAAARPVPEFGPGDTVRVMVKVVEGERSRVQAYEGVVIARSNRGVNSNFTVRKLSYGEGVERVFPLYSPAVAEIQVVRRGRVRRAKLYYLRGRTGKAARIQERTGGRGAAGGAGGGAGGGASQDAATLLRDTAGGASAVAESPAAASQQLDEQQQQG